MNYNYNKQHIIKEDIKKVVKFSNHKELHKEILY